MATNSHSTSDNRTDSLIRERQVLIVAVVRIGHQDAQYGRQLIRLQFLEIGLPGSWHWWATAYV